jgi:NAD(P)-dependent dehydrogenase (short-subunit alcohol dehydrogenase family)
VTELGRIDVLINNVAVFATLQKRKFHDIPLAE